MKWLVKHEKHQFAYNSKTDTDDIRWSQVELAIRKEGLDGWEPWSVDTRHAFNTDYSILTTFTTVWYKRTE